MEFNRDKENNQYNRMIIHITKHLLQEWTKSKVIDSVYGINDTVLNNSYNNLDAWVKEPKVIYQKKYILVETII